MVRDCSSSHSPHHFTEGAIKLVEDSAAEGARPEIKSELFFSAPVRPGTRPSGSPWTDRQVSAAPPTNCGWVWPPGAGCSSRRPCRPWSTACWQNRPRARVGGQGRHGPLMHQRVLELGNGPNTWSTNRPAALAVSICGPSERRPTSRRERSSTSARSSGRDRPSRSSRVTTAVSPATAAANKSFSPGRRARAPEAHVGPNPLTPGGGQRVGLAGLCSDRSSTPRTAAVHPRRQIYPPRRHVGTGLRDTEAPGHLPPSRLSQ